MYFYFLYSKLSHHRPNILSKVNLFNNRINLYNQLGFSYIEVLVSVLLVASIFTSAIQTKTDSQMVISTMKFKYMLVETSLNHFQFLKLGEKITPHIKQNASAKCIEAIDDYKTCRIELHKKEHPLIQNIIPDIETYY